ncbi:MAG TPA: hypothetical protein VGI10_31055 [Polyangiaceae bacterium]|jgi:hypothetical protein
MQDQNDEALISVVVLEAGSAWPRWLGEYQRRAPNSVVVAQSAEETCEEFAVRVDRRMAEMRGETIHVGLLISNGSTEDDTVGARKNIASSMLKTMVARDQGELVLAADVRASDEIRHRLLSLAGVLCDEVRGTEVAVRVRFESSRPESGVMKSVHPPAFEVAGSAEPEEDEREARISRP